MDRDWLVSGQINFAMDLFLLLYYQEENWSPDCGILCLTGHVLLPVMFGSQTKLQIIRN